jgi:hypothetical protein
LSWFNGIPDLPSRPEDKFIPQHAAVYDVDRVLIEGESNEELSLNSTEGLLAVVTHGFQPCIIYIKIGMDITCLGEGNIIQLPNGQVYAHLSHLKVVVILFDAAGSLQLRIEAVLPAS